MFDNPIITIIVLLVILFVLIAVFALLEKYIKAGPTKKTEEKKTESVAKQTAEVKPSNQKSDVEVKTPVEMKIYNSELADDLNQMIKDSNSVQSSRLQIENHLDKESNIRKYIKNKNYHSFDFGTENDDDNSTEEEPAITFTSEDYKRIMALSNIDDNKPL